MLTFVGILIFSWTRKLRFRVLHFRLFQGLRGVVSGSFREPEGNLGESIHLLNPNPVNAKTEMLASERTILSLKP